jgi:xanthine dehydrogenase YagR molybdenum-binding subunit
LARLIRTEKEVEGRYEEVWIVVEEDVLQQWPEGPLEIVGRDIPRVDGAQRVSGQAPYTADLQLPGMLHTAVLRSPYARARVTRIDLQHARSAPGVRAVIGPDDLEQLTDEPGYVGHAVAAVAAGTLDQAQDAVRQIDVDWEVLEPLLDPEEAVQRESYVSDVKTYERGDFDQGVAEGDEVVEAEYRTAVVLHNSLETHQAVCHWEDDGITVYISTQYIWGVRETMAERLGLPQDKVRVVCHAMGGGFGAKNGPGDYTSFAAAVRRWIVALRLPVARFSSRRVSAHFTGRPVRRASSAAMEV